MQTFTAEILIIGINPYVLLSDEVLTEIFTQAAKDKGNIPVKGTINKKVYKQTLVKYNGIWRLYINTTMLKNSPKRIGEIVEVSVEFDPVKRIIEPHAKFIKTLTQNQEAKLIFDQLRPSLRLEIVRYISLLKTEESVERNIPKAINFLLGKGRFIGRDKP